MPFPVISQLLPIHSPTMLSPVVNIEEIAETGSPAENDESKQLNSRRRRRKVASEHAVSFVIAIAEAWPVTWLGFELLRYLCLFYMCILKLTALFCYGLLILPGLVQVGYKYFYSSKIRRNIAYGDQPRNSLDLYLPSNDDGSLKPVVALITGGAWIIGHRAWGTLLGQHLSDRGIIVACIDYRNFPQGTMSYMVRDASEGISFVCNNIAKYGGDPNRIYVMGQSAGAHIAACSLLDQAIKEFEKKESASWSVSDIKAYFGLSGGYNLLNLVDHFHSRGLVRSIFLSIMEGEELLPKFSPELIVQDPKFRAVAPLLPSIILFHGTSDYSIPSDSSESFAESLRRVGVKAVSILYDGKTHTDLFVQDPMRGGKDEMFEHLVSFIHGDESEFRARDAEVTLRKRLVPEFMLQLAHYISPF